MIQPSFAPSRWWRIMPVVFVAYSLGFLDRVNFSFAAAAGMDQDLGISKSLSSLIGSLFFLGYFSFQVPGAAYAQRGQVKRMIFVSLIAWGILASLTGVVASPGWLLLIRFTLGVMEAAVLPALLTYLSHWFTRRERSRANALVTLGNPVTVLWMSIISGYLIRAVGWRGMFIVEGLPALLWAGVWWLTTTERPADVSWLSAEEKRTLSENLAQEQAGMKTYKNYWAAFRTPAVILLCVQYFCWSIGVYGFILWLPSILTGSSKFGVVNTGWLSAGPYLLAIIAQVTVSYFSDRTLERRRFIWICLLIGAVAFCGLLFIGAGSFWLSYGLLAVAGPAMYAAYAVFFAFIYDMLPQNVVGGAFALINGMGALGSFVGVFAVGFLNGSTGNPSASYFFMAGALLAAVGVTLVVPRAAAETMTGEVLATS